MGAGLVKLEGTLLTIGTVGTKQESMTSVEQNRIRVVMDRVNGGAKIFWHTHLGRMVSSGVEVEPTQAAVTTGREVEKVATCSYGRLPLTRRGVDMRQTGGL